MAALVLALMQPGYATLGQGFIASTAGISSIAYGIYALADRRQRRTSRIAIPLAGVAMGAVGTLIMVFYVTTFVVANPNVSWIASPGGNPLVSLERSPVEPATPANPSDLPVPVPSAFYDPSTMYTPGQPPMPAPDPDAMPMRDVMHETARSISGGINLATRGTTPWPSSLAVTPDDQSVVLPTGEIVGRLTRGLQLTYQPSADLMDFTLVITDPVTGDEVEYSTQSGVVLER